MLLLQDEYTRLLLLLLLFDLFSDLTTFQDRSWNKEIVVFKIRFMDDLYYLF